MLAYCMCGRYRLTKRRMPEIEDYYGLASLKTAKSGSGLSVVP
jgi:hypothetical protein